MLRGLATIWSLRLYMEVIRNYDEDCSICDEIIDHSTWIYWKSCKVMQMIPNVRKMSGNANNQDLAHEFWSPSQSRASLTYMLLLPAKINSGTEVSAHSSLKYFHHKPKQRLGQSGIPATF